MRVIKVYDERPREGAKFIVEFDNVPKNMTASEILRYYGISPCYTVYESRRSEFNVIHAGYGPLKVVSN